MRCCVSVVLCLALLSAVAAADPRRFVPLDDVAPGGPISSPSAISANGQVVIGRVTNLPGTRAFRWSKEEGQILAPTIEGQLPPRDAVALTADGSLVFGGVPTQTPTSRGPRAYEWSASGSIRFIDQESLPPVLATSHDGSVLVVGFPNGPQAFWTEAGGTEYIPDCPQGLRFRFGDVSADGELAVGYHEPVYEGAEQPFLWRRGECATPIAEFADPETLVRAMHISDDGAVVIGLAGPRQSSRAFEWSERFGLRNLSPPVPATASIFDISADAQYLVGGSEEFGAYIWDRGHGALSVQSVLQRLGSADDLSGWSLTSATAISGDGRVIAGVGFNPAGDRSGWVAFVPEPPAFITLAVGLIALAWMRVGSIAGWQ